MYEKLKNVNILYVEDDVFIREQTSSLFNVVFNKVFIANDGLDGLNQYTLNKEEIDVVVTDINMPNLSGVEMVVEIKKIDNCNTPIVVVSA